MTAVAALTAAGLAVAAAVGASVRFLAGRSLNTHFPYGTLLVNVGAAFVLGLLSQLGDPWHTVVGVGAIGALSTWSTVANEIADLARRSQPGVALLYLMASLSIGILAAWSGIQLSSSYL